MFIFLIALSCIVFVAWSWLRPRQPSPPTFPGALPLIGHAYMLLGDAKQLWRLIKELSYFSLKSDGVSTIYLGPKWRVYMVTDPDDCLTLSNALLEKPFFYDIIKEWVDTGLIVADVPTWKRHRKLMNPMFDQNILNKNLEVFNSQARRLVDQISFEEGKGKFNTHKYLLRHSTETICQTTFGLKGSQYDPILKEYRQATLGMLEVFIAKTQKLWLHIPFIYKMSAYKNKLDKCIEKSTAITNMIIKKRKAELKANNFDTKEEATTFLDLFLTLAENQGAFCDDEIRQHLETLIFAGYDTVTETMTFVLAFIGSNENVQNRIYKELQEVLGDTSKDISHYDLQRLVYLDAVVKETIRMYPTIPLVARSIHSDIQLKNYSLRAGGICVISTYGIHRHPTWGPDVEQFRPERWLEPTLPDNPNLFAGFGLGKRNCIGKWYAMIFMKTTLAHFLRNYRVTADASNMVIKFDVFIRSVTGHEIYLERRK